MLRPAAGGHRQYAAAVGGALVDVDKCVADSARLPRRSKIVDVEEVVVRQVGAQVLALEERAKGLTCKVRLASITSLHIRQSQCWSRQGGVPTGIRSARCEARSVSLIRWPLAFIRAAIVAWGSRCCFCFSSRSMKASQAEATSKLSHPIARASLQAPTRRARGPELTFRAASQTATTSDQCWSCRWLTPHLFFSAQLGCNN